MNRLKKILLVGAALMLSWSHLFAAFAEEEIAWTDEFDAGTSMKKLLKIYPKVDARTYRKEGKEEWLTYNDPPEGEPRGTMTIHFKNGKLVEFMPDNREEVVKEYLGEYCSRTISEFNPTLYAGIKGALLKLPIKEFLMATDRKRPVLFTEYYPSGIARFATSSEIYSFPDDAPSFGDGLTIIKLNTELNDAGDVSAVEGIILHELAHKILEHSKKPFSCQLERDANNQVKKWGYEKEFLAAKEKFGSKERDGSENCKE